MTEQTTETTEETAKAVEAEVVDIETKKDAAEPAQEELSETEELQAKLADAKNKYAYLVAEMDNTNKRFEREKESLLKYGNEKLLKGMLEVVDNFERTIDAVKADEDDKVKNIVVGIEMVKKQLIDNMSKFGLEEVESLGKEFDPNFHEAVAQESVDGTDDDVITKEYQKGYVLNGRLLRASKVVVNKK